MPDAPIRIEGGIVADPRWNTTPSGHRVGNLTVRAGRSRKEQDGSYTQLSSTGYDIACWDEVHDLLAAQMPEKGSQVTIAGVVTGARHYQDRDSNTQVSIEVRADGVKVWPKRQQNGPATAQQGYGQPAQSQQGGDPWAGSDNQPPF